MHLGAKLAAVLFALILLEIFGVRAAIDGALLRGYYQVRGVRASAQKVVLVGVDESFPADRIAPLLAAIERDRPAVLAALDRRVPAPLAPDGPPPFDVTAAGVTALWLSHDGAPTLPAHVLEAARLHRPRARLPVNYVGAEGLPLLPAERVVRGELPAGTFAGRIVLLGAVSRDAAATLTPVGTMTAAEVQAHALLGAADRVDWAVLPGALRWLLLVILAGALVGRQTVSLGNIVSPFEKAILPGGQEQCVTEPASVRLIAPPRGRKVVVRTQTRALLRTFSLLTLAPAPDAFDAPYRDATLVKTMWRYAPLDERSWVPRSLDAPPERQARLVAQVRLEPSPAQAQPATDGESLAPAGAPERQLVLERAQPDEPFGDGMLSGLALNRRATFQHRGGAAVLPFWVLGPPESNLGREIVARVDGRAAATFRVQTTRGQWSLPSLPPGPHTLELATDAPSLRVLLDQPGAGERHALRNVYALTAPLRVTLRKPSAAPLALDVIVYAPSTAADPKTTFEVTIDGGAPRRLEGVLLTQLTPSRKRMPLPAADRPPIVGMADAPRQGGFYPRLLVVGLGDDLPAGAHTVTIASAADRGRGRASSPSPPDGQAGAGVPDPAAGDAR